MTGLEYILLHVQEPILYVIRKQHRHSPTQATPLADYYIIAGVVYQAPDLASVVNSRLVCILCINTWAPKYSQKKVIKFHQFYSSYQQFTICSLLLKKLVLALDIIQVKVTHGISKMVKRLQPKRKHQLEKNQVHYFNVRESICFWEN